jgi:DNA gyrase subunit A
MTEGGLIKRVPITTFKVQKRNTKGIKTQDDITSAVIRTNTVDSLMVFTNKGTMYRLSVNDIPEGNNVSKGVYVKGLINMEPDEEPNIIYSIYKDTTAKYIMFITKNGLVKKTSLEEYIKTKRKTGVAAITLREGDKLAAALLMESEDLIILTRKGKGIRFASNEVSASGRVAQGMKGINLDEDDEVVAVVAVRDPLDQLGIFCKCGHGKKMMLSELPAQRRGGKGLACIKDAEIAAAALINDNDTILISGNISSVCITGKDVPTLTRGTLGNLMIKNNSIKSVSKV